MTDLNDPKTALKRYLQTQREALLWKLEGLSERELRLPRTPTGTNLLGLIKHVANVEIGYFGKPFGRQWPAPEELVSDAEFDADPQSDWYATEDETVTGIVDFYRRAWAFCDATIEQLPLGAPGQVPWWPGDRGHVTLERIMIHVIAEVARHAGHADIIRELIDGEAGFRTGTSALPDIDWPAYLVKLNTLAERFSTRP
ncbi:DinB family protein [Sinomonas notoginsengisoli]|uniref:DinB family protein n=1 Tax=Sinomonas notoginsengisoli TaxID=1457311 RepID=UPI001F20092D|nr:DinB family protein [Sinomonas notoginsengisoli]